MKTPRERGLLPKPVIECCHGLMSRESNNFTSNLKKKKSQKLTMDTQQTLVFKNHILQQTTELKNGNPGLKA